MILLCKKPFCVEAVEHCNTLGEARIAIDEIRFSTQIFSFSPTQKSEGRPLLRETAPSFRFSKIRFGTESQRHVISVLPGTCEPKPAFPEPTVITVAARGLLVLSPCSRLPDRPVDFPRGSSDSPCGSSASPLRSSLIAPCFLSPSRGLLLR